MKKLIMVLLVSISLTFFLTACDTLNSDCSHSWGEWTIVNQASCTEDGIQSHICNKCQESETQVIEALGHTFIAQVTTPTCTNRGFTVHACICGESYIDSYTSVLDHLFIDYKSDNNATYQNDGTKTATCERDGCNEMYTITDIGSKLTGVLEFSLIPTTNTYEVIGIGTCADGNIIIPSSYNGKTVTGIGENAFNNCGNLQSVTIPNTITYIGNSAFANCLGLTSVIFEEGSHLTCISNSLFFSCSNLINIKIPSSVTSIGMSAFYWCHSLTDILFEDSKCWYVTKTEGANSGIGISLNNASQNATYFRKTYDDYFWYTNPTGHNYDLSITPPNCLEQGYTTHTCSCGNSFKDTYTDALDHDFTDYVSDGNATETKDGTKTATCNREGCNATDTITDEGSKLSHTHNFIDDVCQQCHKNVTQISVANYDMSENLDGSVQGYVIPLSSNEYSFYLLGAGRTKNYTYSNTPLCADGYSRKIKEIHISNNISTIGDYLFYNTGISGIVLPENLLEIGNSAFSVSTNLTNISLPTSVELLGNFAFSYCSKLERLQIPTNSRLKSIGSNVLNDTKIQSDEQNWNNKILYINNYCFAAKVTLSGVVEIKSGTKIIASYAFKDCSSIASLYVPDSVVRICEYAFYGCNSIKTINLPFVGANKEGNIDNNFHYIFGYSSSCPQTIEEIIIRGGDKLVANSFIKLNNLIKIQLPYIGENIENINNKKFSFIFAELPPNLTNVKILEGIKTLTEGAFSGCGYLSSITLPQSLEIIEKSAFNNCSGLTNITIGENITQINENAFYGCSNLKIVNIAGIEEWLKITFSNKEANPAFYSKSLYFNSNEILNITIPTNIDAINSFAFYNCVNILSVNFHQNIKEIGQYAFANCEKVKTFNIPKSITKIGYGMLNGCIGIEDLIIPINNSTISNYFGGFKTYIPNSISIQEGTNSICESAFSGCSALKNISMPETILEIGNYAFNGCGNLEDINLSSNLQKIGNNAFKGCNFTEITIPSSIIKLGNGAFSECDLLEAVKISNLKSWCNIDMDSSSSNPLYYAKNLYVNNNLITELNIPSNVTAIKKYSFAGGNFTCVVIPNSVEQIGNQAFYSCKTLNSVKITNLLTWSNIDFGDSYSNPLYYAHNLYLNNSLITNLTIPSGATTIKSYAFIGSNFERVILPNGVKEIGGSAFANNSNLVNISIPDSIEKVGYGAFSNCSRLEYYHSNACDYLGNENNHCLVLMSQYTQSSCFVTSVYIEESTKVLVNSFHDFERLAEVVIPDNVTYIGSETFAGCRSLVEIVIPKSLKMVDDYVFYSMGTKTLNVFYKGNEEEWNNIVVGTNNSKLTTATIYYYSESEPTESGNYWHYVNGQVVIW